jgi:hypothetical protein
LNIRAHFPGWEEGREEKEEGGSRGKREGAE